MKTKVLQMFSFFASADTALTTKLFANVTAVLNRAKHMQGNGSNAAFLYKNDKKTCTFLSETSMLTYHNNMPNRSM